MAIYRIKKTSRPASSKELEAKEPWRIRPTLEEAADLDMEEIEHLNSLYPESDCTEMQREESRGNFSLIAFIIIVCFVGMIAGNLYLAYSTPLPDLGFLGISKELEEEPALAALRPAVVAVEMVSSRGSGFNIDPNGLIVTNKHVVEGAGGITISFPSGERYLAKWVQEVSGADLALVKIEGEALPYVPLSTVKPAIGSDLVFIGNPLGFDWTVSKGQVLSYIDLEDYELPVMLLSGPIYSGSSGSPVFNEEGQVVAVIFATLKEVDKIGLAIPVEALGDLSGY